MKGRFSIHSDDFLKEQLLQHFETMSIKKLAKQIGVGNKKLAEIAKGLGLKRNRKSVWSAEMEQYLQTHYANTLNTDLGKALNLSESAICGKAFMMQLKKSKEFMLFHSSKSGYKPGQKPWNTGIKGLHFAGSEKTQFKKGHLPHNTRLKDGEISVRKDKHGKPHEMVRVSLGVWKARKIVVWEEHHGTIPKGMCIRVKDGNTLNSNIENLEMVTRKQHRVLNSGSVNLLDGYIANALTRKSPDLKVSVQANKDLINLQRNIYKANRLCKTESKQPKTETP